MSIAEKLLEFAQLETKHSEELRKLADSIKHPVLKALFTAISMDSAKHSSMYRALHELLTNPQPFISEEDLKLIAKTIKKHVETEVMMLEEARKLLASSSDPRVKLVMAAIADDEAKHHELLKSIEKRIAKLETLTEEIYWNMIWRDSPWHGTPGG